MKPTKWPPYVVAIMTFLAMIVVFGLITQLALQSAVSRGLLPKMPSAGEFGDAMDVAFGSPARKLAFSVVINCLIVAGVAVAASTVGLAKNHLAEGVHDRLRLRAPIPLQVVIAILGLVGVTTGLDALVGLLGLRDYGSLGSIKASLEGLPLYDRLLFAVLIGVGPGLTEELFFRGYMLSRVSASQGVNAALVTSSIIFGLFHADPVHSVLAMAMGFYLGFCLLYTGSIWVPVAAHVANNAVATLTTDWAPTDLQALLLIPLGATACGSALVLLSRYPRPLSTRVPVW